MTSTPASLPTRVLRPTHGWRAVDLREVWAYRDLLVLLIRRDIRSRYKQTVLGVAWALVQPLLSMAIFTLVFGMFAKLPADGVPYPIFVYLGLLPWQLFAQTVQRTSASLMNNQHLIGKVYFPRLLVPLSAMGVALVDFLVALSVLLALMVAYDVAPGMGLLALPPLVAGVVTVAFGLGCVLSGASVRYRDVQHLVPFGLQLGMYATPVVYAASLIPERFQPAMLLNPMAGYVGGLRAAVLGQSFNGPALAAAGAASVLALVVGAVVFARVERTVIDVL